MRIQIIDNESHSDETKRCASGIEINKNIITLRGSAANLLHRAMQVAEECNAVVEIRRSECAVIVTPNPVAEHANE